MKIISTNPNHANIGLFSLHCAPNGDGASLEGGSDHEGNPLNMRVDFYNGEATVSDGLGRYLIDKGHAKRAGLITNVLTRGRGAKGAAAGANA